MTWARLLAIELGEIINLRFILEVEVKGLTHITFKEERRNKGSTCLL